MLLAGTETIICAHTHAAKSYKVALTGLSVEMEDQEKVWNSADYSPSGYGSGELTDYDAHLQKNQSLASRFFTSFRRDPNAHSTPKGATVGSDGKIYDVEGAAQATASSPLQRSLKGRHLQMIAIGGSIGTGFIRWLRKRSRARRSCVSGAQLRPYRYYAVLHCPCSWRNGSVVPSCWLLLGLLY